MVSVAHPTEVGVINPVWLSFPDETRVKLQALGHMQAVEGGALLFKEGEAARTAFFPLTGTFLLSKTGRAGRRQVLCKLDSSKCGGPCLLMMGDQNLGDMRVVEPGSVLMLSREQLEEQAIADPALGRSVLNSVVHCMSHFITSLGNLSFNKVAQRVAMALLDATGGDGDGNVVRETQADLAAEVGTTREVVARCLAELQEGGAIKLGRGRITVMDRNYLQHVR
jgi:CRP-like cAMP-binding protein